MQGNEAHIIRQINHVEFENEHEDGDWPIVSKPLELEGVGNVRDMGGIPTQDGRRIRPGMLLRSADLHKATDADLATLDRLGVRNIIDLRTRQERHMEEDRLLPDWRYFPIPVFDEGGELGKQLRGLIAEPGMFIESLYPQMIDAPMAVSCWKDCFGHLLDDGGGTLWHCTQGKDRTGALAALVLASSSPRLASTRRSSSTTTSRRTDSCRTPRRSSRRSSNRSSARASTATSTSS